MIIKDFKAKDIGAGLCIMEDAFDIDQEFLNNYIAWKQQLLLLFLYRVYF